MRAFTVCIDPKALTPKPPPPQQINLQDSLGQDSKTLMIVQASPLVKDVGESQCSLVFASRARAVELGQAKKHTSTAKPKAR